MIKKCKKNRTWKRRMKHNADCLRMYKIKLLSNRAPLQILKKHQHKKFKNIFACCRLLSIEMLRSKHDLECVGIMFLMLVKIEIYTGAMFQLPNAVYGCTHALVVILLTQISLPHLHRNKNVFVI